MDGKNAGRGSDVSKIYGWPACLGYGVGSRRSFRPCARIASGRTAAVLEAALASLADTGNVAQCRRAMNETRRALRAEMEKDRRATIPSEANFVMINVRSDVEPIIAALRQRNVLVGRKFPSMPTWLRVSMGTPEEMQQFVSALREVVPARPVQARML